MAHANLQITTRTVHTLEIHLGDTLREKGIDPGDQVEIVLFSNAQNRQAAPIRLSYTTLMRLTRDV